MTSHRRVRAAGGAPLSQRLRADAEVRNGAGHCGASDVGHSLSRRSHPTTGHRARGRATTVSVVLSVALALVGVAGGTTLALYSAEAVSRMVAIQAGDFDLTVGEAAWTQLTPGVANPATSANPPDGFRSMPGDVFEIRVPVTTVLKGDNLAADLEINVDYTPGPGEHPVTATYHVEDETGAWVAPATGDDGAGDTSGGDQSGDPSGDDPSDSSDPAGTDPSDSANPSGEDPSGTDPSGETAAPTDVPVGTPVAVATLLGDDAGVTAEWVVVVRVEVGGDYRWVTPTSAASPTQWSIGTVTASLKQVRPWEGDAG